MTVDRDQVRLDASPFVRSTHVPVVARLADHCLALLDELEASEDRLAKVSALVEAAALLPPALHNGNYATVPDMVLERVRDALAAWDDA